MARKSMIARTDVSVLRELAERYAEVARDPVQDERRRLWRRLNSLKPVRPLVNVRFGGWNYWVKDYFTPQLCCRDPLLQWHELQLRIKLFHASLGDDCIFEPWIPHAATHVLPNGATWGVEPTRTPSTEPGGAWRLDAPIKNPEDIRKLVKPGHVIDEKATAREFERLSEAFGDILPVCTDRAPAVGMDIANQLAQLRGLEQIMYDMLDNPRFLHELLHFMQEGILEAHESAEKAGDWHLFNSYNQDMPYAGELPAPQADGPGVSRRKLWCHSCAQELTLVSPAMHEEFMLRYQIPIIEKFGLCCYGCCEDLTRKIDMLRSVPNLRTIAVTPRADVRRCAEQIGSDYVISWRPNPAEMVCCGVDEEHVRRGLEAGLDALKGCCFSIILKDVESVDGDVSRLERWVRLARDVIDNG